MSTSPESVTPIEAQPTSPNKPDRKGLVAHRILIAATTSAALIAAIAQRANNSESNDGGLQPVATAPEHTEADETAEAEVDAQVEQSAHVEEPVKMATTPEEMQKCKEGAEASWKAAQAAMTTKGIEDALAKMDAALAQTALTREEIGATPEAIRAAFVRLAQSEFERAEYFRGIAFPVFQRNALHEMHTSLAKAGLTTEAMGGEAQKVAEMEAALDAPAAKNEGGNN